GHHRSVETLYLRVRRFDDVIFVGRVGAAAVTEAEMAGSKLERFAGEHVTGIRASVARPQERIDSEFFVTRDLRFDEGGISRCARGIVSAGHVHFDVAEATLRQV